MRGVQRHTHTSTVGVPASIYQKKLCASLLPAALRRLLLQVEQLHNSGSNHYGNSSLCQNEIVSMPFGVNRPLHQIVNTPSITYFVHAPNLLHHLMDVYVFFSRLNTSSFNQGHPVHRYNRHVPFERGKTMQDPKLILHADLYFHQLCLSSKPSCMSAKVNINLNRVERQFHGSSQVQLFVFPAET